MPLPRVRVAILAVALVAACELPSRPDTPVASVTLAPSSASLHVGDTVRLTATPWDSAGNILTARNIAWTSDSSAVATVTSSGLVRAVAAGSSTIRATSEGKTGTAAVTVTASGGGIAPFGHVFVVTEENHDYASVIGSASMPYLNGLAQQYGLATQYYANTHPSIGNYFMLTTGQIITNNDSYSTIVTVDNVVRRLLAGGKTWKSYAEDLPAVGYTGGDVGNYARKHNVFALLSDVVNDSSQRNRLVPFTQFATDLANGTLPDFSNIVPNLCNDAHDCSLSTADTWLGNNIAPLLASQTFQQDGLLIILFDEAGSDNTNGGGRVAWGVGSSRGKRGYQSTTLYQPESNLRLILGALGLTPVPGAPGTAPRAGEGCWLIDERGKRYLDAVGGAYVANLGHSNPEIAEAMAQQARQFGYVSGTQFTHEPVEELAAQIAETLPGDLSKLYFLCSGSEAVEAALKLARQYWVERGRSEKHRIIALGPGYHGSTLLALSASAREAA